MAQNEKRTSYKLCHIIQTDGKCINKPAFGLRLEK